MIYLIHLYTRLVQAILNINKNMHLVTIFIFLVQFISILTLFGFWKVIGKVEHAVALLLMFLMLLWYLRKIYLDFFFINKNKVILWIEKKNYNAINPLSAIKDKLPDKNKKSLLWDLHIKRSKAEIKKIRFFFPILDFDRSDPLKIRYLFCIFLLVSLALSIRNDRLLNNAKSILNLNKFYEKRAVIFNATIWITPPKYTGLESKTYLVENNAVFKESYINIPYNSKIKINLNTNSKIFFVKIDNQEKKLENIEKNNYKISYNIKKNQVLVIEDKYKKLKKLNIEIKKDKEPSIKFKKDSAFSIDKNLEFTTISEDDYGIKRLYMTISRPLEFQHFKESQIKINIPIDNYYNRKKIESFFSKDFTSNIWAGHKTLLKAYAVDEKGQNNSIEKLVMLPTFKLENKTALSVLSLRKNIALKKISLSNAANEMKKILNQSKSLKHINFFKEDMEKIIDILKNKKNYPNSIDANIFAQLWELANKIEDKSLYIAKKNIERTESELYASADKENLKETKLKVDKLKKSLNDLIDLNKKKELSAFELRNQKKISEDVNTISEEIKDLLDLGSKNDLRNKLNQLQNLTNTIRNSKVNKERNNNQKAKENFINKISKLLNKQELVMEETFNRSANKGKFKQSSKGSGGKSPQEKQKDLRYNLGSIMREIGASENEIPQELGRADRAMRMASKDLDNGRPDRASKAQGMAIEMMQRAINKMNFDMLNAYDYSKNLGNESYKPEEGKEISSLENNAYQGNSLGGNFNIPYQVKKGKAKKIVDELYRRYNKKKISSKEKIYINELLNWY